MVEIEVDFTEEQCKALEERAALMGISFNDLILASVADYLSTPCPAEDTEQESK
jgi:hypothetical protein